jgi:hypothetical protein
LFLLLVSGLMGPASILPLGDEMMIYPVTCLAFIAFGIAFTLFGLQPVRSVLQVA